MSNLPFLDLASLPVAGLALWLMYRLAANHLEHNTRAIEELREAIGELTTFLRGRLGGS